jgi:hypothetical protein
MPEAPAPLPERQDVQVTREPGKLRVERAKRYHVEMLVASLDALLPEDHRARLAWAMAEACDLSRFCEGIKAVEGEASPPAIDLRFSLAVWLYAIVRRPAGARLTVMRWPASGNARS